MEHSNESSDNQEKTPSQEIRQKKSNERKELKRRRQADKEQRRLAREEEKKRKLAEREQKRLARNEERERKRAEREQKKLAREEEKRRKAAEKEQMRLARKKNKIESTEVISQDVISNSDVTDERISAREEKKRLKDAEKEQRRLAREERRKNKLAEKEQKRLAREEEKRKRLEERKQRRLAKKEENNATVIDESNVERVENNGSRRAELEEKKLAEDTELKRKVAERSGRDLIEGEGMSYLSHEGGYPSLLGVICPKCGSTDFSIEGTKGSAGKSIGVNFLFGGIGNMVASSSSKTNFEVKELSLKCNDCRRTFYSYPNTAADDDVLDEPCTVTVKRLSRFYGAAIRHQIFLNGLKIGTIKNNEEITFETYTKTNILFIADQHGVNVGAGQFEFTAENGGKKRIEYKGKIKMLY